ncbi:MAG: MotA/TolQ/ExbB proton channel family protein [Ignavibacteriales bacterium]|nr:MotA/TolQ/ExbB proton channel family protein [Ignavibacteriales bacterium]
MPRMQLHLQQEFLKHLINTAFGIGSSALAIIFYSYFTTKIDKMTYSIDEAGVAIVQNFASHQ